MYDYKLKKNIKPHEVEVVKYAENRGFEATKEMWASPLLRGGKCIIFERGSRIYTHNRGYMIRVGPELLINGVKEARIPINLIDESTLQPLRVGEKIHFGPNREKLEVQII